jgi:hypothetical protein
VGVLFVAHGAVLFVAHELAVGRQPALGTNGS